MPSTRVLFLVCAAAIIVLAAASTDIPSHISDVLLRYPDLYIPAIGAVACATLISWFIPWLRSRNDAALDEAPPVLWLQFIAVGFSTGLILLAWRSDWPWAKENWSGWEHNGLFTGVVTSLALLGAGYLIVDARDEAHLRIATEREENHQKDITASIARQVLTRGRLQSLEFEISTLTATLGDYEEALQDSASTDDLDVKAWPTRRRVEAQALNLTALCDAETILLHISLNSLVNLKNSEARKLGSQLMASIDNLLGFRTWCLAIKPMMLATPVHGRYDSPLDPVSIETAANDARVISVQALIHLKAQQRDSERRSRAASQVLTSLNRELPNQNTFHCPGCGEQRSIPNGLAYKSGGAHLGLCLGCIDADPSLTTNYLGLSPDGYLGIKRPHAR